ALRKAAAGNPRLETLVDALEASAERLRRQFESVRGVVVGVRPVAKQTDLRAVWHAAYRSTTEARAGGRLRLHERVSTDTACEVDAELMEGVFRNLFENAVAVCPGEVSVRLSCRDAPVGGRPGLRVVVRDNGPGLTAEKRARVFKPFYTTRPGGTGLGLGIARRTVRAHGGELSVADRDGPGAAFVISVPRAPAPVPRPGTVPNED
ncbi:MAG: sensor histidine kinase, partial [Gemmata sp.]